MSAAHTYNVPPEVIGGIISRETHAGGAIGGKWNGYSDGGESWLVSARPMTAGHSWVLLTPVDRGSHSVLLIVWWCRARVWLDASRHSLPQPRHQLRASSYQPR